MNVPGFTFVAVMYTAPTGKAASTAAAALDALPAAALALLAALDALPAAALALLAAFDALVAAALALLAAAVARPTVYAATATVCARQGTNRVRCPPASRPVDGLPSSVTVLPSPPTEAENVTDAITEAP